jgi:hypothetical protein
MGIVREQLQEAWSRWLIVDTNEVIVEGDFRKTAGGALMFYDAANEQWVPVSVNYDGAPDKWGSFSRMLEEQEPSGHDWTEGNSAWSKQYPGTLRSEFFEWDWTIADGWGQNEAMGIYGLKWIEDSSWREGKITCPKCFVYTPIDSNRCYDCDSKLTIDEVVAA